MTVVVHSQQRVWLQERQVELWYEVMTSMPAARHLQHFQP